jgi:hypothetical protein
MKHLELDFKQSMHWDTYLNSLFMRIIHHRTFELEAILKGRHPRVILHNCQHLPDIFQIHLIYEYANGYQQFHTPMSFLTYPKDKVVVIFGDGRQPDHFHFDFPP